MKTFAKLHATRTPVWQLRCGLPAVIVRRWLCAIGEYVNEGECSVLGEVLRSVVNAVNDRNNLSAVWLDIGRFYHRIRCGVAVSDEKAEDKGRRNS